jgi:hypothetical protein
VKGGGASRTASACQNCSPTAALRENLHHLCASFEFSLELARVQYHYYLRPTKRTQHPLYHLSIPINQMDVFDLPDLSDDDDALSPKKALPIFPTAP